MDRRAFIAASSAAVAASTLAGPALARNDRLQIGIIGTGLRAQSLMSILLKRADVDIVALCDERFVMLSGEDYLTYPLICVGGKGVISVVSNVAPRDMADLCRLTLEGSLTEARNLYYRLLPICHALFYETNPAPVKAALAMMKKIASDEVRLPLVPLAETNRERLRADLQAYGLL